MNRGSIKKGVYVSKKILGNQALVVTPMKEDGSIDIPSLKRMLEFVVAGGAHGVLVLGSTGEFFSLTADERRQVVEATIEQVDGRCPVGVGTADTGSGLAAEAVSMAADRGADYVLVPPPYYAPLSMNTEAGIYRFFREISEASPIPIMLYDGGSGIEISVDTMRKLRAECMNISLIKLNAIKPAKIRAIQEAGLVAFCGIDAATMPMLRYGANGFTLGVGNLLPRETSDLYDLCVANQWGEAADLYYRKILPLINATLAYLPEYIASFKILLHEMGIIDSPTVRAPLVQLDDVRKAEIRGAARFVGLLK